MSQNLKQRREGRAGFVAATLLAIAMAVGANGMLFDDWLAASFHGQLPMMHGFSASTSDENSEMRQAGSCEEEKPESAGAANQSSGAMIDLLGFKPATLKSFRSIDSIGR